MVVIIKGDVHGDVISDGGVKSETHFHYADEHRVESNIKKQEMHQNTNNTLNAVSHTHQVANISLTPARQSTDNGSFEKEQVNPVVEAIHELTDVVKESLKEPRTQNIYGDKNEFQDGAQLLKMGIPEGTDPAEIAACIAEQQRALLEQNKEKK